MRAIDLDRPPAGSFVGGFREGACSPGEGFRYLMANRGLWRYAIALKEKGTFQEGKVTWTGDLGLWHTYLRSGRPQYDLVQREAGKGMRIYYGVSEDGIHGPRRAIVGMED